MTNEFAGTGNGELLKSLVSISDAINEQIFNANQTIDGSFINRQAIIADIDPIENLKLQMEEREKDEDAKDNLVSAGEQLENAREEQERAREEAWDNSMHNFAGMDMDGTEIDSLMDYLKNPSNRQRLIAKRMQANGGDINKATKEVDNAILYGDLYKKIENHTATASEKAEFDRLDKTPGVKETIRLAHEEQRNGIGYNDVAKTADTKTSVSVGANAFDTNEFPNAPNLGNHFIAAKSAISPLDNAPKIIMASNEKQISITPSNDSGLAF